MADLLLGTTNIATESSGTVTLQNATLGSTVTIPAATLGSGVTFPAGHVINSWKVIHDITSSIEYAISTTHAVIDFGAGKTMQITGITATEGNLLLITSNVGQLRTHSDGTYNSNVGPVINGVNYNTHSTYNGQTYNQLIAVNTDVIYTVPASFTSKTISINASKQGGSGTHGLRVNGSSTGVSKATVFVSVLEIKQ